MPRLKRLCGAGVKVVLVNKLQARIYIKIIIKCIYPRIKLWICLWAGHRAVGRAAKRCARPFQVAKAAGWATAQPVKRTNVLYLWNEQNYKGHPRTHTHTPAHTENNVTTLTKICFWIWVYKKMCAHFSKNALEVLWQAAFKVLGPGPGPFWGCQSITQLLYGM